MKTACIAAVVLSLAAGMAEAGSDKHTIWGAVLGAGAGLALGESVDDIDTSIAIPALAIAGGLIGHELDRAKDRSNKVRQVLEKTPKPVVKPGPAKPNYHPGVEFVKIPIRHKNGMETDIRLIRLGDAFVGPRGERYETLPTSKALAETYGM